MMKKLHTNILKRLDLIIKETADHIHDFIDSKSAFTRKRKLDAFDDDSQLMSASASITFFFQESWSKSWSQFPQ